MEYCLTCGNRLRGHNTSASKPLITITKNEKQIQVMDESPPIYTWECLNKDCPQFKILHTDAEMQEEIPYLIRELNELKKTIEAMK